MKMLDVEEASIVDEAKKEEELRAQEEDAAFLGRGKMDLTEVPAGYELVFGTYNERQLVPAAVRKLVRSFEKEGKHMSQSPIIILVDEEDLVPGTYAKKNEDVPWHELPMTAFQPRTGKGTKKLIACSGQHRRDAVMFWKQRMQVKKEKIVKNIREVEEDHEQRGEGVIDEEEEQLERLREAVTAFNERIADAGKWLTLFYLQSAYAGVTLWDQSVVLIDGVVCDA